MSPSQTNEQALESAIEKHLTGTCLEELKEKGIALSAVTDLAEFYNGLKQDLDAVFKCNKNKLE